MENIARDFILSDLKQKLPAADSVAPAPDKGADRTWVARINQWLQNAEQESIAREAVTAVNPHVHIEKGSAPKRLLKRFIRKMVYWLLQPVVVQQSGYNTLTNDVTNQLRDSICVLKDVVASQQALIQELTGQLDAVKNRISEMENKVPNQIDLLDKQIKGALGAAQRELTEQRYALSTVTAQVAEGAAGLTEQGRELSRIAEQVGAVDIRVTDLEKPEDSVNDYMDYAAFENQFRGSQEEIRSRIRRYLTYFSAGDKVLDLGCGRGEWLELLKSIGAEPVGVDLNENTVSLCRRKGLSVVQDDLFDYLERQEDSSLDGITAIQVVEHLTPVQLLRLTQLCYRKLKFGGHIIFETQNPAVVYTMTNYFLVDPTHIRPVHPTWAKYVLENTGFSDVRLDYPEYAWVTDGSIPPLDISGSDTAVFNQQISYLNNLLYGSTDYAIIAVKN